MRSLLLALVILLAPLGAAAQDSDAMRFAGDAYADASGRLLAMLNRHLDDEEDLIVPIILARGESDLGL